MFTGRSPFEGQPAKGINEVLTKNPTPPSEFADVPSELDEILLTALAKQKEKLYDHVLYLRDDLQTVYESK